MNTITITAVTILLFTIDVIHIDCRPTDPDITYNIQACGTELADLLKQICSGVYNRPYGQGEEDNDSAGSREKRGLKPRGITYECCQHPCKWNDLVAYCLNGSSVHIDVVKKMPRIKVCETYNKIDPPEPDSRDNEIPLPKKTDNEIPTLNCNSVQSTSKPSMTITSTQNAVTKDTRPISNTSSQAVTKKNYWSGKPPYIVKYPN